MRIKVIIINKDKLIREKLSKVNLTNGLVSELVNNILGDFYFSHCIKEISKSLEKELYNEIDDDISTEKLEQFLLVYNFNYIPLHFSIVDLFKTSDGYDVRVNYFSSVMQRNLGDIFKFKTHTLQVAKEYDGCSGCYFALSHCLGVRDFIGNCTCSERTDKRRVIFKRIN